MLRTSVSRLFLTSVRTDRVRRRLHVSPTAALGKEDLVKIVSEKTGLTQIESKSALEAIVDSIVNSVAKGEPVRILGFGSFERLDRAARKGRNPKTGAELDIPAKKVPSFKAAKNFKDTVDGSP